MRDAQCERRTQRTEIHMAIQMRRGEYDDFDASKMLAGELAVVVSGDPETEGGALYVATAAGSATRVAFANEIPGDATTTSDGLMSAADKAKLDGVAAGAQANVIESVSVNGNNATVTGKAAAVTIPEATDAASGVMGAGDKTKLDGIETGANAYTLPAATTNALGGVKPDGTTVTVDNDGTIHATGSGTIPDGSITGVKIADNTIPDAKLAQTGGVLSRVAALTEDVVTAVGMDESITPVWTVGKRISEDGSVIASGNTLYVSDPIDLRDHSLAQVESVTHVEAHTTLSMPSIHYYDASDAHVGYAYAFGDYDMTADIAQYDAVFVRLSTYSKAPNLVEDVRVLFKATGKLDADTIDGRLDEFDERTATAQSAQFVNLLDGYTNSENGVYITNGQPVSNPNWCSLLDYVPVKAETTYSFMFAEQFTKYMSIKVCYYDAEKSFISDETHADNAGFTTPETCAFVRLSITNTTYEAVGHDNFDTLFMEEVASGYDAVATDNKDFFSGIFPKTTLTGKKWALFGDSITQKNFRSNVTYHDYIRAETGIVTINEGVGGSGYKNRDDNNNAFYQIALKTASEWSDADVITVMGGVNDMWSQIATYGLGTSTDTFTVPSDITKQTSNTVMACFNYMLGVLIENAPNARIGVISPLPCVTTQGGRQFTEVPYDEQCNMSLFVEACKESCALHGIPYLDLFHNSGLRPWDSTFNARYFKCISSDSPDGLHPNELGHRYFYPMVREFVKSLI